MKEGADPQQEEQDSEGRRSFTLRRPRRPSLALVKGHRSLTYTPGKMKKNKPHETLQQNETPKHIAKGAQEVNPVIYGINL